MGSDFCRFGVGDSIALAIKIENEFQGFDSPHKMKLATAGCPRNCSEAMVKDVGAVAVEGGKWEIYIGGAAGSSIRKGDILCVVDSHEDVLKYMGRFIQYYRENAKYLERTHGFVTRVGIDKIRAVVVDDSEGIAERLDREIAESKAAYKDPWKEAYAAGERRISSRRCCRCCHDARHDWNETGPAEQHSARRRARLFASTARTIAVFRTRGGGVYAVQAECPHRGRTAGRRSCRRDHADLPAARLEVRSDDRPGAVRRLRAENFSRAGRRRGPDRSASRRRNTEFPSTCEAHSEVRISQRVPMNIRHKATSIRLLDFHSAPMRAFHMTWLAFFLCFFGWFGIAPLMPIIRTELHLTKEQVGNSAIAAVAITILVRMLMGWLCDRIGPRRAYTGC